MAKLNWTVVYLITQMTTFPGGQTQFNTEWKKEGKREQKKHMLSETFNRCRIKNGTKIATHFEKDSLIISPHFSKHKIHVFIQINLCGLQRHSDTTDQ